MLRENPDFIAKLYAASSASMKHLHQNPEFKAKLQKHLQGDTNPFRNPSTEMTTKRHATLQSKGYTHLSGGNGQGLTDPQALLARQLNWPTEVVIPTKRKSPWPTSYKVDIASPELRIAIEVDGRTHATKQGKLRDHKKDMVLTELGWTVLRYPNQQVLTHPQTVLKEIMSIILKQAQETTSQTDC